jgi:hypothetical protein
MSAAELAVAVIGVVVGFAAGYGFRGWIARRTAGRRGG